MIDYISAIHQRISRRSYLDEPIGEQELATLQEEIARANEQSGLAITFLADGSEAFDGIKSYGMFSGVRSLIVLKGRKTLEHLKEKVGYYGEQLVLAATALGLGTCWVGGTFDRDSEVFHLPEGEEIVCVITVGKVVQSTLKEKVIRGMIHRKTKSIEEMTRTDRPLSPEEEAAMELVQHAPTARNTQKVVFSFSGDRITAGVPDDAPFDLVDLGICKLHFALGMRELFPHCGFVWGNAGVFDPGLGLHTEQNQE